MGKNIKKDNIEKATVSALSNSFSIGGGGVDFEHRVQATFLLALLVDGFTPLLNLPITSVQFQVKRIGHDVDDLLVESSLGESYAKLFCQIKHGVKITENKTFKEIIVAAWSNFNKTEFDKKHDKIVLISGAVANANSLRFIHDQAKVAYDSKDFIDRVQTEYYTNDTNRAKLKIIKNCLKFANKNQEVADEQLWEFCKVFTILIFDLDYESSVNEFLIRALIASNCKEDSSLVWSTLIDYAGRYDKAAAYVTLNTLPNCVRQKFTNIISVPDETIEKLDFALDSFWAKLALVGDWDEKNDSDKKFLELFLGKSYVEIQKFIREDSLQPNPNISFSEGLWHINHKRSIVKALSKTFFDDDIKTFFELSSSILKEKDRRIQDNGDYDLLVPSTGSFEYSATLRKGIINGLAIICNLSGIQLSCSSRTINDASISLIRGLFYNSNSLIWMSLDSQIPIIAEINPLEYLDCLEKEILEKPQNFEILFPRKNENLLFSKHFISSILWSLEGLAWKEDYFVKCIRVLGLLSKLKYDKTNCSHTPINSIISIMLPWHLQTLASKEKQKNAIKALQIESPDIAWRVIQGLLPYSTRSSSGTYKPRYIISNLPKEIKPSNNDVLELYQYYSQVAVDLAKKDYSKLCDLLSYYDNMNRETVVEYLNAIIEQTSNWDDSKKYPFWKEFINQKELLIHDDSIRLDESMVKLLDSAIERTKPSDIRYIYRRIYEPKYFDYNDDGEFNTNWEAKRNKQELAVYEIFIKYGIESVIEFAKEVDNEAWIAQNLGKKLKGEEITILLKKCYDSKLDRIFFASVINGYIMANGCDAFIKIDLGNYNLDYIAWVLSCVNPSMRLFEIVDYLLGENNDKYWDIIFIPRYGLDDDIDLNLVWNHLIKQNRYAAAINLFGITVEKCSISHDEIYKILNKVAITEGKDKLDPDAVRNLIELLQQRKNISVVDISNVEMVYLSWLSSNSKVEPLAIRYRLANEPEFFCELVRLYYRKRHSDKHDETISQNMAKRLFEILHDFCVVPGTDWDGNYNEEVFCKWIEFCKSWSKNEDREDIVQQIIGNGLSHARKIENGLIDEFLMRELNKIENEQMRRGYRIGIYNQRGVRWIDPEGKPEFELAKKYKEKAEMAESLGYALYAETLYLISDNYVREAEDNIKEHRLEIEAQRRENDDN